MGVANWWPAGHMHVTSCYRYVTAAIVTTAENTNNVQLATKHVALRMLFDILATTALFNRVVRM